MPTDFKNILVIKPSSLGDIVTAIPAVSALRKTFPAAKISWLVRPEFASLLRCYPDFDGTILFDRKNLSNWWRSPNHLNNLISLIKQLRDSKFDAVVDFQGLFRTALIGLLTGCENRFGMSIAREFAPPFYTNKVTPCAESAHVVDYYLKIVRQMGATDGRAEFKIRPPAESLEWLKGVFDRYKLQTGRYAVLVPSALGRNKCWPAANFAAIAERISRDFGFAIITIGTANDAAVIEKVKSQSKVKIIDLTGRTDIPQMVALLSRAGAVVSNDTGPGQIASVFTQVPMVMVFGRTNPARLGPYGRVEECSVAVDLDKRGRAINSPLPAHRIEAVGVDMVYEKLRNQLKNRKLPNDNESLYNA